VAENFPEKSYIRDVYEHIQYYYQMAMGDGQGCVREFNLEEFCVRFHHFPVHADSALRIINQAGYLEYTDEQDNASRIMFLIGRDELYRLRDESPEVDTVLKTILRNYTGLFSEYVFISEEMLVARTGLTRQQVYNVLVALSKRGVIHYIPRKKTPYIVYTRERVAAEDMVISREVYEDRKEKYEKRIDAMIAYASEDYACRSRVLLDYFGEKDAHNCGICDVCLSKKSKPQSAGQVQKMEKELLEIIGEGDATPLSLHDRYPGQEQLVDEALDYLLGEELIEIKSGVIHLT
jgi:ATP-dependent DNA helicase RecQ